MMNRKQMAHIYALASSPIDKPISIAPHDNAVVKLSMDDKLLRIDTSDLTAQLASLQKHIETLNKKRSVESKKTVESVVVNKCAIGIRFTLGKTIICQWGSQVLDVKCLGKYDGTLAISFPQELPTNEYSINVTSNVIGSIGYTNATKTGSITITYLYTGSKSIMNLNLEINLEIKI